ncbi:iron dicitrate transport regulator FecR [Variovorax sp. WS11]|uniref:FecR family protein n=1 Tax=Variovorax sp. WS11 TaxID=1105204 RepID=UPI000D0D724E|nr:FecR domain-containing protein [Variovorax sp. WS11]NDZ18066.1 iron dicitrate transport regulator FecR [Variovorax sp. WS11]PSL80002.1 iron dicitrate transport regulator FecR [Variovorax sp. WS11]
MTSALQERLVEQALTLIVRADVAPDGLADPARKALGRWGGRSAEHAAAMQEARRRWDALGGMAGDLRARFDEPQPQAATRDPIATRGRQRRNLLLSIAGLLGTGVLAGRGAWWYWQQPVFTAAYETRTAQMLKLALADGAGGAAGSQLELAPLSAVKVLLYRQRRVVEMARGEVRFEVVRDPARPFEVRTREARIEVIGTVFTVRDRGGAITVGVEHGHVRVKLQQRGAEDASGTPDAGIDLLAGQVLDILDGRAEAVRTSDAAAMSAWRDGWLVFENAPLGEALATINAYRATPIVAADARVEALRLTGRFRASESAGLVAALPTILPLTAASRPDGSVELRAR